MTMLFETISLVFGTWTCLARFCAMKRSHPQLAYASAGSRTF
jgi:hypothetical protein